MQQKDVVGRQWNLGFGEVVEHLNPSQGINGTNFTCTLNYVTARNFHVFAVFIHKYTYITLHWLTFINIVLFK
jgi:hypothetical protein